MKKIISKIWENFFSPNTENAQKFISWIKILCGTTAAQQYFYANNIDSALIISVIGFVSDFIISSSQKK